MERRSAAGAHQLRDVLPRGARRPGLTIDDETYIYTRHRARPVQRPKDERAAIDIRSDDFLRPPAWRAEIYELERGAVARTASKAASRSASGATSAASSSPNLRVRLQSNGAAGAKDRS
jgi:hypothetical protein